jgi:hypothetical protein
MFVWILFPYLRKCASSKIPFNGSVCARLAHILERLSEWRYPGTEMTPCLAEPPQKCADFGVATDQPLNFSERTCLWYTALACAPALPDRVAIFSMALIIIYLTTQGETWGRTLYR